MAHAITVLQRQDEAQSTSAEEIIAEHRAINDALMAGDVPDMQRLVLEHIAHYEASLLAPAIRAASSSRRPER